MNKFQIAIRKLSIHFSKPIWGFIRNCVFWLFRLNKIAETRRSMDILKGWNIDKLMGVFGWKEDTIGDWTPWASTVIAKDLQDDCDGAAALAKWWFKEHGVEAEILNLYSDKEGHAVCVTRDRETMVSNERVVNLNPTCWEKEMLEYFGNKYTIII